MQENKRCWGLLRRRQCVVPTWRGWLALFLVCAVLAIISIREIHPFLAVTEPLPGGVLVVEGWAPDYALEATVAEFRRNHYDKLYVTGGPLEAGAPLSVYKTFAELGAATLLKLGLNTNEVQAVPAPLVRQDRTYVSAVSLRRWLSGHGLAPAMVHLISEGPHARRSRLMFERALGKGVKVGVTAVPSMDYDERHWWRSSAGVRGVIAEALAYGYARVWFRAPRAEGG
ncbi:MAG TPA: ElyC/SanA/YdcF family protein [Candidatus Binatia bacterium]|jgi:hypothetical protein|nr:ElyC/SanA/YdcF family protein [Candidatus Binatia bacterium]